MKLAKIGALLVALAMGATAQAQVKISDLPAGAALAGTEAVPAVQSATTVKTTPAAINTYVQSQTTSSTITGKFSGTCDSTTYLRGDGSCNTPAGTQTNGTFSTNFSGFTTIQSGSFAWWKNGNMVMLQLISGPNGTSSSNEVASNPGTLPVSIRPAATVQLSVTVGIQDNGTIKAGCAQVLADGSIQFGTLVAGVNNCGLNGWTSSGTKIVYGSSSGVGTAVWMYPVP